MPNTAFVKLGTNIPKHDYIVRGCQYVFNTIICDPIVLFIPFVCVIFLIFTKKFKNIHLALGVVLYGLYIIYIGGDFMMGRHFTVMFLMSVIGLIYFANSELSDKDTGLVEYRTLMAAEKNVRSTFKGLQLVGRYVGFYKKTSEDGLIEAVYKASPSLVLLSDGIRKKDCWVYSRRNRFNSSIFLYYRDIVGIFSKRVKRISDRTFEKGLEIWGEILRNPLKLFLIFPYMWYILVLVWYRLLKK